MEIFYLLPLFQFAAFLSYFLTFQSVSAADGSGIHQGFQPEFRL